MKKITNWQKATVVDIEADDLLEGATKIHVLSYKLAGKEVKSIGKKNQSERVKKFFKHHTDQQIPVVMHNGISYDAPLVEKILGIDLSELMVIDTLGLSWHLNPNRPSHGLDSFFPDYGIEKPKVSDWQNLSFDEYRHRCEQDVLINTALWEDLSSRLLDMYCLAKTEIDAGLVGGKRAHAEEVQYIDSLRGLDVNDHVDRLMTFVMFKMDCARLQEKTRWKVDEDLLDDSLKKLNGLLEEAQVQLEAVMPEIPQYSNRKKPAKPYKQNGELSASGQSWQELQEAVREGTTDEKGNPIAVVKDENNIKKLKGYNPPNINSSQQLKDFLFSKGWEPETFKYDRDQEAFDNWIKSKPVEGSPRSAWTAWKNSRPQDRKIPQLSVDGKNGKELCPSVVRLAEDVPEIMYYNEYTTIKHRRDLLKGFKESMSPDGYLQARVGGFTNTFRVKHRGIVNLPGVDKPYGEEVRGCLIAEEGYTSLGSDLSSLEDRVKMHFMIPHDPEYVETMNSSDFDPHLKMAVVAGFITESEVDAHKAGDETENSKKGRKLGKSTNYAAVYNSGAKTLARTAKIDEKTAQKLLDGYWKLNWSVKAIAEEQVVITCSKGMKWLINPINGFCYSLRKESDRFSTLCQGTGSFFFDMWVDKLMELMYEKFKTKRLTGSFHDEIIIILKNKEKTKRVVTEMVHKALNKVNEEYLIRKPLGCDVQFGKSYAEIH